MHSKGFRRRFLLLSTVLPGALISVLSFSVARADEPGVVASSGLLSDQSSALVEQGIALRGEGDDAGALAVLLRAEALEKPSPRLLVHLAAAHQALGHWEPADRYLALALTSPQDSYIVRHQQALREVRQRIDLQIATLEVQGQPEGAQIYVNGRLMGELPLRTPLRITAGVYTLEVRHPQYYSTTRSLALAGGVVTRESIVLASVITQSTAMVPAVAQTAAPTGIGVGSEFSQPSSEWLGWTLAALSAASAAGSFAAWKVREGHADNWNDNARCQGDGLTRGELCLLDLEDGEKAETLMFVGLGATGVLAAAALYRLVSNSPNTTGAQSAFNCGVGPLSLACSGRF